MAVWSEWKNPSTDPVNGDWDFFVSDGTFVMKKLVDGAWVDVASFSAGGIGPAGDADKVDGMHAADLRGPLTKSVYNVYNGVGLTAGTYTIDLNGHVPAGSTMAFIRWKASGATPTVTIKNTALTETYFDGVASTSGSCMVALDANYCFKVSISADCTFTIGCTFAG